VLSVTVLVLSALQRFKALFIFSIILLLPALLLLLTVYSGLNKYSRGYCFGGIVIGIFGIIYAIRRG
jgi:hypothetical protein